MGEQASARNETQRKEISGFRPPRWLVKRLVVGLIFGIGLAWGILKYLPDDRLHLVTCDVGQGDAILVTYRSSQVLVDGGPDNSVLDCLARHIPFWDRTIEVAVLTHPQADHLNGLVPVIERFAVDRVVVNGLVADTAGFRAFRDSLISEGAKLHLAARGDQIRLNPLRLSVLWPEERLGTEQAWREDQGTAVLGAANFSDDVNESSVVLSLGFGAFDALLTGDLGFAGEQELVADGVLTKVEVLKVGHHGSKFSSGADFLEAIRPQVAVVSVGKNRYGHPTPETLERLSTVGVRVLRTDLAGDIEVVTDGNEWWVAP